MEFNNQVYRAPSLPKMNRRNISSSVMSGAQTGSAAPKLRRSSFSFVGAGRAKIASGLKIEKADVGVQLEETNRILIEIQKQLALDFGNRIVEKRQLIAASKAQVSRQRASDKESAIESMRKSGAGILKVFEKVAAPAKGIFQRILDFFSIILTGLLVNNAFKWLENPANRAKVEKFFNFVVKHWKELLALYGTYKLIKIVAALKRIADLFKKPPRWPGGGKGGGGKGGGGKGGGGGDPCGAVLSCGGSILKVISDNATAIAAILAGALSGLLSPLFGRPAVAQPDVTKKGADIFGIPWEDYQGYQAPTLGQSLSQSFQNFTMLTPGGGTTGLFSQGLFGMVSRSAAPVTRAAKYGVKGKQSTSIVKQLQGIILNKSQLRRLGIENVDSMDAASVLQNRMATPDQLLGVTKGAANKIIKRFKSGQKVSKNSFGGTIPGLSGGGTVGGTGSGFVDSVRALLAPGEEVIRASAAMLFRPLLKDINNNAGRLWNTLSTAVISLIKSNETLESGMRRLKTELDNFKIQLDSFISQEKLRKENKGGGIGQMPAPPRTGMVAPEVVLHSDIKQPPRRRAKSSVVPIQLPPQTLPPTNMPKFSSEGATATEEPEIGSTNPINPYMVLTPQILGIFV